MYLQRIEQEISRVLPAGRTDAGWREAAFGRLPDCVQDAHLEPLRAPARELVALGGKRWRPLLLVLCARAEALRGGTDGDAALETAYRLAPLVECIHTASLIHDDIEDGSDQRRGKPAAHLTYGLDTALNAGSWLYFQAFTAIDGAPLLPERKGRLYALCAREVRRLHLGQAMDIAWHRDAEAVPSVEEYLAMVRAKTGTLAALACRAGVLASGGDEDAMRQAGLIAADIGAGFQILDDVTNLTTGNPGKKRGDDIVEGKKSLPVLLFAAGNGMGELSGCFARARAEGIRSPAVEQAIGMLEGAGVVERARAQGEALIVGGAAAFGTLFGTENPAVHQIAGLLEAMAGGALPAARR